eukprot:6053525-Lingulodinium_polyedra.AAC.1
METFEGKRAFPTMARHVATGRRDRNNPRRALPRGSNARRTATLSRYAFIVIQRALRAPAWPG